MALKIRGNKTIRVALGDDDWLEVRPELTKAEFRDVINSLPENLTEESRMTYDQSDNFLRTVFSRLVVDWSVVDEDGNRVPATLENLDALPRSASTIIETALMNHFNSQEADEDTQTKSEGDSETASAGIETNAETPS
jgi:hypothetical protein